MTDVMTELAASEDESEALQDELESLRTTVALLRDVAAADAKKIQKFKDREAKHIKCIADLRRLVKDMDNNRDALGDACRCCNERLWVGPNGDRRPHHLPKCRVHDAFASEVLE